MSSGVYVIENLLKPGAVYVGSSCNLEKRKIAHFCYLRAGNHHSEKLQRAYNKYGESAFVFKVLFTCPINELFDLEQKQIDSLGALDLGYNVNPLADSARFLLTPESQEKARLGRIGKKRPPGFSAKISEFNRKRVWSKESLAKLSANALRREAEKRKQRLLCEPAKS